MDDEGVFRAFIDGARVREEGRFLVRGHGGGLKQAAARTSRRAASEAGKAH